MCRPPLDSLTIPSGRGAEFAFCSLSAPGETRLKRRVADRQTVTRRWRPPGDQLRLVGGSASEEVQFPRAPCSWSRLSCPALDPSEPAPTLKMC